jgi:hypothetical protein
MLHADTSYRNSVMDHLNTVHQKLVGMKDLPHTQETLDQINKNIAEIQWFTYQTTPYLRGSAGIGDITGKSLYEAMGIQVSPWNPGVSPDLEAFAMPLEEYIEKFPSLMKKPPQWVN